MVDSLSITKISQFDISYLSFILPKILMSLGILAYIYSIYKTGIISNISAYNEFGLLSQIHGFFYLSIILVLISSILELNNNNELSFVFNLLILSIILWGTPYIVEEYPRMWDAWGVGFLVNYVKESNVIDFSLASHPEYRYLEFPGSFIFFAIILLLTNIKLFYFMNLYPPIFAIPITFLLTYVMAKLLTKNFKIAGYFSLIFLLLNMYFHFHLSPESLSLILFYTFLIIYILNEPYRRVEYELTYVLVLLTIILTHPTNAVILIMLLFLNTAIYYLYHQRIINIKLLLLSIVLQAFWFMYMSTTIFDLLISINFISSSFRIESQMSSSISTILSTPQMIRSIVFFFGMLISFLYIIFMLIKNKKPTMVSSFFLTTVTFYFMCSILNLGLHERAFQIGYIVICIVFACIIYSASIKKNSNFGFIILICLLMTSTIYIYEYRDVHSVNLVNGYNFILDNNGDKPFLMMQNGFQSQIFLLIDDKKFEKLNSIGYSMNKVLYDLEQNNTIILPPVVVLSEKAKREAAVNGLGKGYSLLESYLNEKSYNKIYETTSIYAFESEKQVEINSASFNKL